MPPKKTATAGKEEYATVATATTDAETHGLGDPVLTSEGSLIVEAQSGDGGSRDIEVTAAQGEFDALAATLNLGSAATGQVVRMAAGFVVEMFKHRPKPWSQMSKAEHQDLLAGIEHNCHALVQQIAEAVVAARADPIRCLFVGFTDKGEDIKAELKLKAADKEETDRAVLFMHKARGQNVLITLASATEFHREPADDTSEDDQRGLNFESGSDEHPGDDSDLVDAADPTNRKLAILRTGDRIDIDLGEGETMAEVRVDLASQVIETRIEGGDWCDLREATPAELAAERERTADFAIEAEAAAKVDA